MFCTYCGNPVVQQAVVCPSCGTRPFAASNFCWSCGAQHGLNAKICLKCGVSLKDPPAAFAGERTSSKSRLAFVLLGFFLGGFGIHRFYAGKIGTAIAMLFLGIAGGTTVWMGIGLLPLSVVGIWALIDCIYGLAGHFKDGKGAFIKNW